MVAAREFVRTRACEAPESGPPGFRFEREQPRSSTASRASCWSETGVTERTGRARQFRSSTRGRSSRRSASARSGRETVHRSNRLWADHIRARTRKQRTRDVSAQFGHSRADGRFTYVRGYGPPVGVSRRSADRVYGHAPAIRRPVQRVLGRRRSLPLRRSRTDRPLLITALRHPLVGSRNARSTSSASVGPAA